MTSIEKLISTLSRPTRRSYSCKHARGNNPCKLWFRMYGLAGGWIPSAGPFAGFFCERSLSFRFSRASPERVASSYPLLRSLGRASLNGLRRLPCAVRVALVPRGARATQLGCVQEREPFERSSGSLPRTERDLILPAEAIPYVPTRLISQDLPELIVSSFADSHRAAAWP